MNQTAHAVQLDAAVRVDQAYVNRLHVGLQKAIAALPDAWFATQHGVPRELIDELNALVEEGRIPLPLTLEVHGGAGTFHACRKTGVITTPRDQMPDEYSEFTKVDVEEYLSWVRSNNLGERRYADLLEVRLFNGTTSQWEEAEDCYRQATVDAVRECAKEAA